MGLEIGRAGGSGGVGVVRALPRTGPADELARVGRVPFAGVRLVLQPLEEAGFKIVNREPFNVLYLGMNQKQKPLDKPHKIKQNG